MADNPHVNKVVYGTTVLVDLTKDTVTAAKMLSGTTAHDKSGASVTGSIASRSDSGTTTLNATTTTKSYSAGYYASAHGCKVTVYDGSVT